MGWDGREIIYICIGAMIVGSILPILGFIVVPWLTYHLTIGWTP